MEIKEIKSHYNFLIDKAISFGFTPNNGKFIYTHNSISKDMKFVFSFENESLYLFCIDKNFDDIFIPFEDASSKGEYVTSLRKEASMLLDLIKKSCFEKIDIEKQMISYIKEKYRIKPSFPFKEEKEIYVFRKKTSKKWFALVQTINLAKIGLDKEEGKIANVKLNPNDINSLIDYKNIFPCYHMNKSHWVSLYLNKNINVDKLKSLLDLSYSLVI